MDILSSTLGNPANFNPTTTIDSVVSSLQLLATVASFVNVSWPENSPVQDSSTQLCARPFVWVKRLEHVLLGGRLPRHVKVVYLQAHAHIGPRAQLS
ncbi:hypothetical protein MSG28_004033 [Choristoneura fumiferana]|uniref:Uncharacterized protein n=1 Tax=Choristoneura fumiferana TaxID=7141 RepID=A0ACC0KH82_CHOFU|nr:hypothetical protein MSG28_004033 [Choristoneura fumiferana]